MSLCLFLSVCASKNEWTKGMIVFKIHSLGESGKSFTLMWSWGVKINPKCCKTGLEERPDSPFIAVAAWVMAVSVPAGGMGGPRGVWAAPSPVWAISPWVLECTQQLPTEIRLPLNKTHGKALAEPQDGYSIHWNILLSRLCSFQAQETPDYSNITTSFGKHNLCSQLCFDVWVSVLESQSVPPQGDVLAFFLQQLSHKSHHSHRGPECCTLIMKEQPHTSCDQGQFSPGKDGKNRIYSKFMVQAQ